MAYAEDTAANPSEAIAKIVSFAQTNGWTVVQNLTGSGTRFATVKKGSSDYIHLWNTDAGGIGMCGSIGFTAGSDLNAMADRAPYQAFANIQGGPYTKLYLFADTAPSDYVYCVIEMTGGEFRTIVFGQIEKFGGYTGGTFFDATYWNRNDYGSYTWTDYCHTPFENGPAYDNYHGSIRVDVPDRPEWKWYRFRGAVDGIGSPIASYGNADDNVPGDYNGAYRWGGVQHYGRNLSTFSPQVTLGPILLDVGRTGGKVSPIGVIPNIRYTRMTRFTPGQEITVGTDTWKIFPFSRKVNRGYESGNAQAGSRDHAWAIKKTV